MSERSGKQSPDEAAQQTLIKIGFTAILLGYLMVWLPHNVAGLSFIGLEMGEWVKFIPQVRSGDVAADRNLFYLPPITLGLMLALWTAGWSNRRWQTWAMRALAVLVALLAFPAVEAILDEGSDQWLGRLLMILVVVLVAACVPLLDRLPAGQGLTIARGAMVVIAVAGMILPTWAYLAVRPAVSQLFSREVGIGPGFWLNAMGHMLVGLVALTSLIRQRRSLPEQA